MAAAPELLKVVNLIMKRPPGQSQDADAINEKQYRKLTEIDIDEKVENIQYALKFIKYSLAGVFILEQIKARQRGRELSTELTHIGATLYDLLGKETVNQEKRNHQAGRQLESSNADTILHNVIATANTKLTTERTELDAALMERQAISAKIERKKADLERLKQRLDTLQKIRFGYFPLLNCVSRNLKNNNSFL